MTEKYKPARSEITSMELIGRRQKDGKLRMGVCGDGAEFDDWPSTVVVCEREYALSSASPTVHKSATDSADFEWAIYE